MDFVETNKTTVPLIQEVVRSCDHHGLTCLPGCQAAIDAVLNCGHPSVSSNEEMEYMFHILIYTDILKYEAFVSSMRSCTPLPPLVTDDTYQVPMTTNDSDIGQCMLGNGGSSIQHFLCVSFSIVFLVLLFLDRVEITVYMNYV